MSSWPDWDAAGDPAGLVRYVQTGVAARVLDALPLRAEDRGDAPLGRLQRVYDAFAARRIRFADEPLGARGWQSIRPPGEVLTGSRTGNCVDLAVAFAGACLDAGVHPVIVLLQQQGGRTWHVLVTVWLEHGWPRVGGHARYGGAAPSITDGLLHHPSGLRTTLEPHGGGFLAVDVEQLAVDDPTQPAATLDEAVASAGRRLADAAWTPSALVDVGRDHHPRGALTVDPAATDGISTHARRLDALSRSQRELMGDRLAFVAPSDVASPIAPANLLGRAVEAARRSRGLLLHGVAGIGKTRTSFEVAGLADRDGWAVLHVAPGEPLVTVRQLSDAVRGERNDRVLVIMDYVNDAAGVDFLELKNTFFQSAARDGVQVAILACSRTGWFRRPDKPALEVFEGVELQPDDEQLERTRDSIHATLAPTAMEAIGVDRLRQLTGSRPGIVTLIALEAESLARAGRLTQVSGSIRPEDLVAWLARRLDQDQLFPEPEHLTWLADDGEPSARLLACLAMFAAGPQPVEDLRACAEAVEGMAEGGAEDLVVRLENMGWLVPAGAEGSGPVHDLVTDQMTERLLLVPDTRTVRRQTLRRFLDAGLVRGRTVGRYSTNLGRAVRDLDRIGADNLVAAAGRWFDERAAQVGVVMAETSGEGAYALGAVLESAVWADRPEAAWDDAVGPWLAARGLSPAARHLLYKGLRLSSPATRGRLVGQAIDWLGVNGDRADASFVLGPLLLRRLEGEEVDEALRYARAWLNLHGTTAAASFVLHDLLGRPLPQADVDLVLQHALTWLEHHGLTESAQFILTDLFNQGMVGMEMSRVVRHALAWLDAHPEAENATFVLRGLLGQDLDEPDAVAATQRALGWLHRHGHVELAQYVINGLLRRPLGATESGQVLEYALAWLNRHRHQESQVRQYVLMDLMKVDLSEEATHAVVRHTVDWLDDCEDSEQVQLMLRDLLGLRLSSQDSERVLKLASSWLRTHHLDPNADFALRSLLDHDNLPEVDASVVLAYALDWLEVHEAGETADYVLRPLLERQLSDSDARRVIGHALVWLGGHDRAEVAQFALRGLLERGDLNDWEARRTAVHALTWLGLHHQLESATFVLRGVLTRELPERDAEQATRLALTWLSTHGGSGIASFVLRRLLVRRLPREQAQLVTSHALSWVGEHHMAESADFVMSGLLSRELSDDEARVVRTYAFAWLEQHRGAPDTLFLVRRLLAVELDDDEIPVVVRYGLAWLDAAVPHDVSINVSLLLGDLLLQRLEAEDWQSVMHHALRFVERHYDQWSTGFVLARLLDAARQDPVFQTPAQRVADSWLQVTWLGDRRPPTGNRLPPLTAAMAARLLDQVDQRVGNAHTKSTAAQLNSRLSLFCDHPALRCGVSGARLDDALRVWLCHPDALRPGTFREDQDRLASRLCSLAYWPDRLPVEAHELFRRVGRWVGDVPGELSDGVRALLAARADVRTPS